jgi:uncharacterized lipoprotein YddW (UPF0748 family)
VRGIRRAAAAAFAVVVLAMPYAVAAAPRLLCLDPIRPCAKPLQGPDLTPYRGLGTWVDAYDFSREYHGRLTPSAVDTMAKQGVKTLYLQAAKERAGSKDLLSPDLLEQYLDKAHSHGMQVVAWFLPRLVDTNDDWRHIQAILDFRTDKGNTFDAFGLDIESREVGDVKTRNARLVALSQRIADATGDDLAISAIVVPPVVTDVINPKFWPDFPWTELKPLYDVWVPMDYWTNRKVSSGYRDAYKYTADNVRLLREDLQDPNALVHVAGGIGDESTTKDYDGFVRAANDGKTMGVSCYDWATTAQSAYATLRKGPA